MAAKRTRRPCEFRIKAISLAVASCFSVSAEMAFANPTGGTVVSGTATFNQQGSTLAITNSPGAIINWRAFSIGTSETTRFIQQSAASSVLNRVVGVDPSVILGALQSNGRVFLINPNGILFGAGAQVDVAGLVASTLNLSNADFAAGRLRFTDTPGAGSISNQGTVTTPSGGQVYLIAPNIQNSGIISSPKGEVILAAGHTVELVDAGTPNLRIEITAPDTQAVNIGQIVANSGKIGIYAGLIKNSGEIRADGVVVGQNGEILLKATNSVSLDKGSVVSASGPTAGKVTIQADTGTVTVAGTVAANATQGAGGTVNIAGAQGVNVGPTARISADGTQGGSVSLASSSGNVTVAAPVTANATAGGAGQVAVNAAASLTLAAGGQLSASGGAGGGLVTATGASGVTFEAGSVVQASGAAGGTVNAQAGQGTLVAQGTIDVTATDSSGGIVNIAAGSDITLDITSRILARGRAGGEVRVESTTGTLSASGVIDGTGSGGPGGLVWLLAPRVALFNRAVVDVSGDTAGGTVLVGGDYHGANPLIQNASQSFVDANALISADAISSGNGGKVIIWGNDTTQFYGTITARGGANSGNGGFVETSGGWLDTTGTVNTLAAKGSAGTWLLDPHNITVQTGGLATLPQVSAFATTPAADSTIDPSTINAAGANVVLQANNDITFNNAVSIAASGVSLTAQAGRAIIVNANISTNNADISLTANQSTAFGVVSANRDPGAGGISMASGTTVNAGTGNIFLHVDTGSGHGGATTASNIVFENLIASNVSIINDNLNAGSNILRGTAASLITASTALFMELEFASGATDSIGTSLAPIRIDTPILETHYHQAGGGIFINSPNARDLQIGGVDPSIFSGLVRGVQTVSGGPISITVNGNLTQLGGNAGCGLTGGAGGPICASSASSDITLVANNLFNNGTILNAGRDISVTGNDFNVGNSGMMIPALVQAGRDLTATLTGNMTVQGGDATVGTNVTATATVLVGRNANITATGMSVFGGNAGGGGTIVNDASALVSATGNMTLTMGAGGVNVNAGTAGITPPFVGYNYTAKADATLSATGNLTMTITGGDLNVGGGTAQASAHSGGATATASAASTVSAGGALGITVNNGNIIVRGGDATASAYHFSSFNSHTGNNTATATADVTLSGGTGTTLTLNGVAGLIVAGGNAQAYAYKQSRSSSDGGNNNGSTLTGTNTANANANVTLTATGGNLTVNVDTALIQVGGNRAHASAFHSASGGFNGVSFNQLSGDNTATANANINVTASNGITVAGTGNTTMRVGVDASPYFSQRSAASASAYKIVRGAGGSNSLTGVNQATATANVKFTASGLGGLSVTAGSLQVRGGQAFGQAYDYAVSGGSNILAGDHTAIANSEVSFNATHASGDLTINVGGGAMTVTGPTTNLLSYVTRAYKSVENGNNNDLSSGNNNATGLAEVKFTAGHDITVTAGSLSVSGSGGAAASADKTMAGFGNFNQLGGTNTTNATANIGFTAGNNLTVNLGVGGGSLNVSGAVAQANAYHTFNNGGSNNTLNGDNIATANAGTSLTAGNSLTINAGNVTIRGGWVRASAYKNVTGSSEAYANRNTLAGTNTANGNVDTLTSLALPSVSFTGTAVTLNLGGGNLSVNGDSARAFTYHNTGQYGNSNNVSGDHFATANSNIILSATGGALTVNATGGVNVNASSARASAYKSVSGGSNTVAGNNTSTADNSISLNATTGITLSLGAGTLNIGAGRASGSAYHSVTGGSNAVSGNHVAAATSNINLATTTGTLLVTAASVSLGDGGEGGSARAYMHAGGNFNTIGGVAGVASNTTTSDRNVNLSGPDVTFTLTGALTVNGQRADANAYHSASGFANNLNGDHNAAVNSNINVCAGSITAGACAGSGTLTVTAPGGVNIYGRGAQASAYKSAYGSSHILAGANTATANSNINLTGANVTLSLGAGNLYVSGSSARAYAHRYIDNGQRNSMLGGDHSATANSNITLAATGGTLEVDATGGINIYGSSAAASAYKNTYYGNHHLVLGNNTATATSGITLSGSNGIQLNLGSGSLFIRGSSARANAYHSIYNGSTVAANGNQVATASSNITLDAGTGLLVVNATGGVTINASNAQARASAYKSVYGSADGLPNHSIFGDNTATANATVSLSGTGITLALGATGNFNVTGGNASANAYRSVSGNGNTEGGNHTANATSSISLNARGQPLTVTAANMSLADGGEGGGGALANAYVYAGGTNNVLGFAFNDATAARSINLSGGSIQLTLGGNLTMSGARATAKAYHSASGNANTLSGSHTATATNNVSLTTTAGPLTVNATGGVYVNGNSASALAYRNVSGSSHMVLGTNTATANSNITLSATGGDLTLSAATLVLNSGVNNGIKAKAYQQVNYGSGNTIGGNDTAGGGADIKVTATGNETLNVAGNFIINNNNTRHYSSVYAYQYLPGGSFNSLSGVRTATGHADILFDAGGTLGVNVTAGGGMTVNASRDNWTSAYAYRQINSGTNNTLSGTNQSTGQSTIGFSSTGDLTVTVTAGSLAVNPGTGFAYNYTSAYAYNQVSSNNNNLTGSNVSTANALLNFTSRSGNVTVAPAAGLSINGNFRNYTSAYAYNQIYGSGNTLNVSNTTTGTAGVQFSAALDLDITVGAGGVTAMTSYGAAYAYNVISGGNNNNVIATNTSTANSLVSFAAGGNLNITVGGGITLNKNYTSVYAYNEIIGAGNIVTATNTSTANSNINFTGTGINVAVTSGNFSIQNSYASVYAYNYFNGPNNTVTATNTATGNSSISFSGTDITIGPVAGSFSINGSYASVAAYNRVFAGSGNTANGANTATGVSNILLTAANTLSIQAGSVSVQAGSAHGQASNNVAGGGNTVGGTNTSLADANVRLSAGLTSVSINAGSGAVFLGAGPANATAANVNTAGGGNTMTAHANVLVASGADMTITGGSLTVQAGTANANTNGSGSNTAAANGNAGVLALGSNTITVTGAVNVVGGSTVSMTGAGATASAFAMLDPAAGLNITANSVGLTTNAGGVIFSAFGPISVTAPGGFIVNGSPIAGGFAGFTSDPGVNFGQTSPIVSSVTSSDPLIIAFGGTTKNLTTLFGLPAAFLPPPAGTIFWDDETGDHLWLDPLNWSSNTLPGFTQSVVIGSPFSPITLTGGAATIKSLVSDTNIIVGAGGTLTMSNPSVISTTLAVSGGTVNANGGLTVDTLNVSSGALNGHGNLVVGNSFTQTGGSIGATFASIDITQSIGNLALNNALSAPVLTLHALSGNITQAAPLAVTGNLGVEASGNVTLMDAGNQLGSFSTTGGNVGGNISLNTATDVTLAGVTATGNINVTSAAAIHNSANITSTAGGITLTANGASGDGFVQLASGNGTNVTAAGAVVITSANDAIIADNANEYANITGSDVTLNAGSFIWTGTVASKGNITATTGNVLITAGSDVGSCGGPTCWTGSVSAPAGNVTVNAGGFVDFEAPITASPTTGTIGITASGIYAGGNMSAKTISLNSTDAMLNPVNDVIFLYNFATLTGGTINMQAVGNIYLEGVTLHATQAGLANNVAALTLASTAGNVTAPGNMTTVSGAVSVNAAGYVEMDAASNGGILSAAGDANIVAGTSIVANGTTPSTAWMNVSGTNVTLNAGTFVNIGAVTGHGLHATNGNVNVTAGTSMGGLSPGSMKGPIVAVNGDVHISLLGTGGPGTSFFDFGDSITAASAGHNVTIDNGAGGPVNSSINIAGPVTAGSNVTLRAANFIDIGNGGITSTAGNVVANSGNLLISSGAISAGGTINLTSAAGMSVLVNSSGSNLTATNNVSGNLILTSNAPVFTVGAGGATLANNAPGGQYFVTAVTDMVLAGPTGNSQYEVFGAGNLMTVNGYANMSGLGAVISGGNVTFSGGMTNMSGPLAVFAGGNIDVFTTVQAGSVSVVANTLNVNAGNFRSLNANFVGTLAGDVNVSNGGIIFGNPDVNKLTVGGKINIDDPGSRIEAASANSIHISFPNLQKGGFFVNGTADQVWDSTTNTGFYAGGLPAVLGSNLLIDYGVPNSLIQSVVQALNTTVAAVDQSVTSPLDNKKDKDSNKEGPNNQNTTSLGKNLKLLCD